MAKKGKEAKSKDEAADEAQPKSKLKLIIIIVSMLLLVGASVGGTLIFLSGGKPEVVEVSGPVKGDPRYIELHPAFTVNIDDQGEARFLRIKLAVMTYYKEVEDALDFHRPAVRNTVVVKLSSQEFGKLREPTGRDLLRDELLAAIKSIIEQHTGEATIENLFFTDFVIQ